MKNMRIGTPNTVRLWKSCFLTLAIVFQFTAVNAAEIPAETAPRRVQMLPAAPRLMRLDSLREWCRGVGYDACTVFISQELTTSCMATAEGWTLRGNVRVLPRIYLANARKLTDEMTRLRDVEHSAERYLDDIQKRSYVAEDACRQAGRLEEAGFATTFRRLAKESQQKHR